MIDVQFFRKGNARCGGREEGNAKGRRQWVGRVDANNWRFCILSSFFVFWLYFGDSVQYLVFYSHFLVFCGLRDTLHASLFTLLTHSTGYSNIISSGID